jgi:hypothetical protein
MAQGMNAVKILALSCLLCWTAGCKNGALRKEVIFTAGELQKKIDQQFPMELKGALAKVELRHPAVFLDKDTQRIGLRADMKIAPPIGRKFSGQMEFDAGVEYLPERGEFFLVDSRVRHFQLDDVPEMYQDMVRGLANEILKRYLEELPIYKLDENDFKESLAKLVLKSVVVKEGKLVLDMGLL